MITSLYLVDDYPAARGPDNHWIDIVHEEASFARDLASCLMVRISTLKASILAALSTNGSSFATTWFIDNLAAGGI